MTKTRSTKSALISSVIALLLCFAMLVGSTFAWFTDSVTSANNIIKSGNLDIELEYAKVSDGKITEWDTVAGKDNIFDKNALWEPGRVEVVYLKVSNLGTLALKYQLGVNIVNEIGGKNVAGEDFMLSDHLVFKVVDLDSEPETAYTREEAVAEAGTVKGLKDYNSDTTALEVGGTDYVALIVYMPESVGNEANYRGDAIPTITLGVNLYATQQMSESDSFGNNYDEYAGLPWDGSVGDVPAEVENVITITNAAELAAFAADVNNGNTYSGKTVKLAADINLNNKLWTPIGQTGSTTFAGIFDGNGKTLYNLNIDNTANTSEYGAAGLFGWVEQHSGSNSIKNLTIDGVTINSHRYSGAVAGWINIPVTNCVVKNVTINCSYYNDDTDGTKVGALVGYADNKSALTGNTVENAVLNAYGDVGGLVGVAQTTVSVDGNTVKNVQINYASTVKSEPGALASTRVTPVYGTNTTENVTFVKSVIVSTADELAAALKSTDKDIVITLANDIDVPITSLGQQTGGSGEYKLAGEETETITLNLNGKKLNITTTYWSNIGAKNDNAVFTIKNGTMTSSQATGTWNSYDVTFSNCNYMIEDVVFEKAIAFANTGKSAKLNNVTVNETHDYYAIWICAAGMDVEIDGLTINSAGRGIKIDEEYEGSPAKVTLKVANADFNTVKKAAIIVKSAAGADITLSNVNIADTIDTVHAVWVDEDSDAYAALVNVTGGEVISEANVVDTAKALADAVAAGKTDLWLLPGEYNVYGCGGKTLTINGTKDAVLVVTHEGEYGCDYGFDGATVTFNGVTIDTTKANSQTWPNYARMNGTFNGCVFNGTYAPNRVNNFTDCTFNVTGNSYNLWLYGASTVSFENCTFNCDGKSIYVDGNGATGTDVIVKNCTFNDKGTITNKAAIEVGNTYGSRYSLTISETVVNGFAVTEAKSPFVDGTELGTNVWGNKNYMTKDNLNVVIDGTDVY